MRRYQSEIITSFVLIAATLVVFWNVKNHQFLNFDDNLYVTANSHVKTGLSVKNIKWAFTNTEFSNWHPLTWLSHMLDCQLYGLNPKGHHLTSLILHIANSLLLFFVLSKITGAFWKSTFVAALFALHPLHVESVAWVSERKDVLSTLFWILTMWAYYHYIKRPEYKRYLLVLIVFGLGLMAKQMLVTLPFVLLLMDYWPLGRFQFAHTGKISSSKSNVSIGAGPQKSVAIRLLLEKIPFFVLTIILTIVAAAAQQKGGAVVPLDAFPLETRIANALVSYVSYIGKMIWPGNLAVIYPHPGYTLQMWKIVAAALLLICITFAVVLTAKRLPYLLVGWFWYLGTLVPVIGFVQIGGQAMADRYTYVPFIGLFIIIAWGAADLTKRWHSKDIVLLVSGAALLAYFMVFARLQVDYWRDSFSLFEHALKITSNNYLSHNNFGIALMRQGKIDAAIEHYKKAVKIVPKYGGAHSNLGYALVKLGKIDEAIEYYNKALHINPYDTKAHINLGHLQIKLGKVDKAIKHYNKVLLIDSNNAKGHNNLAIALMQQGKINEAIKHYNKVLLIKPNHAGGHNNLAIALMQQGKIDEAIEHYNKLLLIDPNNAGGHGNLAIALMQQGKTDEAIEHFSEVIRIKPESAQAHFNMGAAMEKKGKLDEAAFHYKEVLRISPNPSSVRKATELALHKAGKPRGIIPTVRN